MQGSTTLVSPLHVSPANGVGFRIRSTFCYSLAVAESVKQRA